MYIGHEDGFPVIESHGHRSRVRVSQDGNLVSLTEILRQNHRWSSIFLTIAAASVSLLQQLCTVSNGIFIWPM